MKPSRQQPDPNDYSAYNLLASGSFIEGNQFFQTMKKQDRSNIYPMLIEPNKNGLTALDGALNAKTPGIIKLYCRYLEMFLSQGIINKDQYITVLLNTHSSKPYPLSLTPHYNNMEVYLRELFNAKRNHIITEEQYSQTLLGCNDRGESPFHYIIRLKNSDYFKLYCRHIQDLDYSHLLYKASIHSITPLNLALSSGDVWVFSAYQKELEKHISQKKITTLKTLKLLLGYTDQSISTPICNAAQSGNLLLVKQFLQLAKSLLSTHHLLLMLSNTELVKPETTIAPNIRQFLQEQRQEYDHELRQVLLFKLAFGCQHPDVFTKYRDQLHEHITSGKIEKTVLSKMLQQKGMLKPVYPLQHAINHDIKNGDLRFTSIEFLIDLSSRCLEPDELKTVLSNPVTYPPWTRESSIREIDGLINHKRQQLAGGDSTLFRSGSSPTQGQRQYVTGSPNQRQRQYVTGSPNQRQQQSPTS